MIERRTYPLLAVVLTAGLVCLSLWRLSAGCPGDQPCSASLSTVSPPYQLVRPSNATLLSEPYDCNLLNHNDSHTLIDLHNFTFLMNEPVCNASAPPLVLVLVHTAPDHTFNRHAIRSTWGKTVRLVFLVGEPESSSVQESLERENEQHHDLVQGNFLDSYRNLTYKHVSGLKWVTYHCPGAKYILKIDDDVFVNTPFLQEFLSHELSPLGARRLVLCDVLSSAIVKRSYRSKWRVSPKEYADRWYPDYCMGWAILYSPDAVFLLYREAQRSPYFWIDDVHVTGTLLARLNMSHTGMGSLALSEHSAVDLLHSTDHSAVDFLFSLLPPTYFHQLWQLVTSPSPSKEIVFSSAQPWTRSWARR